MVARLVRNERAGEVVGAAYDALTPNQRRRLIERDANSFFGVIRSRLEFPEAETADLLVANADRLARLIANGLYSPLAEPAFYLYELATPLHRQVALVGNIPVVAVDRGDVRGHELTRPSKEEDLIEHRRVVGVESSPVGLTYRATAEVDELVGRSTATPPAVDLVTVEGVRHRIWRVDGPTGTQLRRAVGAVDRAFIIDGHHRVAAAVRAGVATFFAALIPQDQLQLLPYHRLVASPPADLDERLRRAGACPLEHLSLPATDSVVIVTPEGTSWLLALNGPHDLPSAVRSDGLLRQLFDVADFALWLHGSRL